MPIDIFTDSRNGYATNVVKHAALAKFVLSKLLRKFGGVTRQYDRKGLELRRLLCCTFYGFRVQRVESIVTKRGAHGEVSQLLAALVSN